MTPGHVRSVGILVALLVTLGLRNRAAAQLEHLPFKAVPVQLVPKPMLYTRIGTGLYQVDTQTGAIAAVGDLGTVLFGLTYDSRRDVLYGLGGSYDAQGTFVQTLCSLDRRTLQVHTVATIKPADHHYGPTFLAYDRFHDVLYGASYDGLYRINAGTGEAVFVGPSGVINPYAGLVGLAFDAHGRLWRAITTEFYSALAVLDVTTGTEIAGNLAGQVLGAITFDPQTNLMYTLSPDQAPLNQNYSFVVAGAINEQNTFEPLRSFNDERLYAWLVFTLDR